MRKLRQILMAASLGVIPAAQAQETAPKLYASDALMPHLEPMKHVLLKLTGMNTIVLSRQDIMTPVQIAQNRIIQSTSPSSPEARLPPDLRPKMMNVFSQYKSVLPENFQDPKYPTEIFVLEDIKSRWIRGEASAHPLEDDHGKKVCVIIAPEPDIPASEQLRVIAGLPSSMASLVKTTVKPSDLFDVVVGHEGAHCGQKHNISSDSVRHKLYTLEAEIDADQRGLQGYQEAHANNPEKAGDVKETTEKYIAARTIGIVRNSINFDHLLPERYFVHGTHLALDGSLKDKNIDAGDIILAGSAFATMNNYFVGFAYAPAPAMDMLSGRRMQQTGADLNRDHPFLQYAAVRTINDVMKTIPASQKPLLPSKYFELAARIGQDFEKAFETLVPEASGNPVVKENETFMSFMARRGLETAQLPPRGEPPRSLLTAPDECPMPKQENLSSEAILKAIEARIICRDKASRIIPMP